MAHAVLHPSRRSVGINTIFCIGRNYARHAAELGNTTEESPVVFLKPVSSVIHEGSAIELPAISSNVHHEAELVVLIGKGGRHITRENALQHVAGYAVGLDLTARDVQDTLKAKGLPWTIAKGFDTSACLSDFLDAAQLPDPTDLSFTLHVNGVPRQDGRTAMMLFPVDYIIAYLSSIFTLAEGDIIFTGTPEGVARIEAGDELLVALNGGPSARFIVSKA